MYGEFGDKRNGEEWKEIKIEKETEGETSQTSPN